MQILGNSYSWQSGTDSSGWRPQYDPTTSPLEATAQGGCLYNLHNGKSDTIELSNNMLGNAVVYADKDDKINLTGKGWHQTQKGVTDDKTGFKGELYEDNYGHKVLIAHDNPDDPNAGPTPTLNGTASRPNFYIESDALLTLTTDGNFEKVDADHKDGISLQEAKDACAKTPEDTEANKALKKALTYLTTDGHWEALAGGSDKNLTLAQLQKDYDDSQHS